MSSWREWKEEDVGAEHLTTKLPIKPNYSVHRFTTKQSEHQRYKERWDDLHNKQDMHSQPIKGRVQTGEAAKRLTPYQNEWEIVNEDKREFECGARLA